MKYEEIIKGEMRKGEKKGKKGKDKVKMRK